MKFDSRSAIESDNSAKAGSNISRGESEIPPALGLPDSWNDDFEEGRRGVVGREVGRRDFEPDRLMLSSSGLFETDILIVAPACILAFALEILLMYCRCLPSSGVLFTFCSTINAAIRPSRQS